MNLSSHFDKPASSNFPNYMSAEMNFQRPVEKPQKRYSIIIPSCASWFDIDKIHQIEKDYLPEFFSGKPTKTPDIYKKYRNFIIDLYRQNPTFYLNSTTCRKNLAGDACSIMRIHSFLEHWGIINFNMDPPSYPKAIFLNKPNYHSEKMVDYTQKNSNLFSLMITNQYKYHWKTLKKELQMIQRVWIKIL